MSQSSALWGMSTPPPPPPLPLNPSQLMITAELGFYSVSTVHLNCDSLTVLWASLLINCAKVTSGSMHHAC